MVAATLALPLLLGSAVGWAAEPSCRELIEFYGEVTSPPLLAGQSGLVVPREGDWSAFLSQTLRFRNGETITIREFERLGPEFWQHFKQDWMPISEQVAEKLRAELQIRGIPTSEVYSHPGAPLLRSAMELTLPEREATVVFDPALQMGVQSHPDMASRLRGYQGGAVNSPLALSWLGMGPVEWSAYQASQAQATELLDELVIKKGVNTGVSTALAHGNLLLPCGPFSEHWPERQERRGSRRYRLYSSELAAFGLTEASPATEIRSVLHALEEKESAHFAAALVGLTENPDQTEKHHEMVLAIRRYLHRTGVETKVEDSDTLLGYRLLLLPTRLSETAHTGFPGLPDDPPVLVSLAQNLAARGFNLGVSTDGFGELSVNVYERWVEVGWDAIFDAHPLEEIFFEIALPAGGENRPGPQMLIFDAADLGMAHDPALWTVYMAAAQRAFSRLSQLRTLRLFFHTEDYQLLVQNGLESANKFLAMLRTLRIAASLTQEQYDAVEITTLPNLPHPIGLIRLSDERNLLFVLTGSVGPDVAGAVRAELAALRGSWRDEEDALLAFEAAALRIAESAYVNQYSIDELKALDALESKARVARQERFLQASPADLIRMLIESNKFWSEVKNTELRSGKLRQVGAALLADPELLAGVLPQITEFLSKPDLHEHWPTVSQFHDWLEQALEQAMGATDPARRRELVAALKRIAQHSKDSDTAARCLGLLATWRVADPDVLAVLTERLAALPEEHSGGGIGLSFGLIAPLVALFPQEAIPILVPRFLDPALPGHEATAEGLRSLSHFPPKLVRFALDQMVQRSDRTRDPFLAYLVASRTTDPDFLTALLQQMRAHAGEANGAGWYLMHAASQLPEVLPQMQPIAEARLTAFPETSDGSHLLLGKLVPDHPLILAHFVATVERRLASNTVQDEQHLREVFTRSPNHPILVVAVAKLEAAMQREYRDFRAIPTAPFAERLSAIERFYSLLRKGNSSPAR